MEEFVSNKISFFVYFLFTAFFVSLLFSCIANAQLIEINSDNFPDDTLREYLEEYDCYTWDMETGKKYLDTANTTYIETDATIKDLTGIELLSELDTIYIGKYDGNTFSLKNPKLKTIDIKAVTGSTLTVDVPALEDFGIRAGTVLTKLDISKLTNLKVLYIAAGYTLDEIKGLDQLKKLESFDMCYTPMETVDLSGLTNLRSLFFKTGNIKYLDISMLENLNYLVIDEQQLEKMDLSQNHKLENVYFRKNEKLDSLVLPDGVVKAECNENKLTCLDLSACTKLKNLSANNNVLSSLDVSKCSKLETIDVSDNNLKKIDVKKCRNLCRININGNKKIKMVDFSKNKKLLDINIGNTNVKKIDTSKNRKLYRMYFQNTRISKVDFSNNKKLKEISYYGSKVKKLNLSKYKEFWLYYEVDPGTTIKLANYIGKGYKFDKKERHIYTYDTTDVKYNAKKRTITISKDAERSNYQFEFMDESDCPQPQTYYKEFTLIKGKKKIHITIFVK